MNNSFLKHTALTLLFVVCICAPSTKISAQEQSDQSTFRKLFSSDLPTVTYNNAEWKRKVEPISSNGDQTVELSPEGSSPYRGTFFNEYREIRKSPDNKYTMRSLLRPTETFAFALGTALIASCVYCWYHLKGSLSYN